MDEPDPEECVSCVIESQVNAPRAGILTGFVVRLGRADGEVVPPVCVETTDDVIELVRAMAPARITIRSCDSEARKALLCAFTDADVDDPMQQTQRRTLH